MTKKSFLERYEERHKGFDMHAIGDEIGFSWRACDTCGSNLGGNRHACTVGRAGEGPAGFVEVISCDDCVIFAANGQLPDESADEEEKLILRNARDRGYFRKQGDGV